MKMKKIFTLALLVVMVAALLVVGCQKSIPAAPAVTGEASTLSEEQQISNSLDDLNDLDSLDQDLSADLEELDNLPLE